MTAKELVTMPTNNRAGAPGSYSAAVRMDLLTERACLSVAQVGPDFIIMATATNLPATTAELVIQIDGHEKRRTVYLPNGIQESVVRTQLRSVPPVLP